MNNQRIILIKVIGVVICVCLVCFTILEIFGIDAAAFVVQRVLIGLTSLLVGSYAIAKKWNGNGKGGDE